MTATGLATALIVGLLIGALGHSVIPRGRVPFWVSLAVGTGAVLLGSIVARIAGIGVAEFSIAELLIQIVFGVSGIALVAGTADRQPSDRQDRPA
jgi:hypothetical protein